MQEIDIGWFLGFSFGSFGCIGRSCCVCFAVSVFWFSAFWVAVRGPGSLRVINLEASCMPWPPNAILFFLLVGAFLLSWGSLLNCGLALRFVDVRFSVYFLQYSVFWTRILHFCSFHLLGLVLSILAPWGTMRRPSVLGSTRKESVWSRLRVKWIFERFRDSILWAFLAPWDKICVCVAWRFQVLFVFI